MLCFNLCNHALGPVAYLELKSECIVRKYDLILRERWTLPAPKAPRKFARSSKLVTLWPRSQTCD